MNLFSLLYNLIRFVCLYGVSLTHSFYPSLMSHLNIYYRKLQKSLPPSNLFSLQSKLQ